MARTDLLELLFALDSLEALKVLKRYKGDPKAFILERCRTYDPEADPEDRTAKPMQPKPSVLWFAEAWRRGFNFDWPKSRRTLTTWSASDCCLNEMMTVKGTKIYVISEVDEKSEEIVARIAYIFELLDEDQGVELKPLFEITSNIGSFTLDKFCGKAWGSEIIALSQREQAMRGYGGSVVWIDECGVQARFKKLLQTVAPAARRVICTGTIESTKSWDERVGTNQLRRFDGPELVLGEADVSGLRSSDSDQRSGEAQIFMPMRVQSDEAGASRGKRLYPKRGRSPQEKQDQIEELAFGIHRWMRGTREVYRCHFRSDSAKDNDDYVAKVCSALGVSPKSPEWRTEMEMDPDAYRGLTVYEEYDEDIHVGNVGPERGPQWMQVVGADFGSTAPTAFVVGSWNGHWLRVWHLHYAAGRNMQWHKEQMLDVIRRVEGKKSDETLADRIFQDFFKLSFGDPTTQLIPEYATSPYPWFFLGKIFDKKVNDQLGCESAVKTLLDYNGVCCDRVTFTSPCPHCKKEVELEPGIMIDRSCVELRHQLKTLRRIETKEGLETPEKSVKVPDHATDGLKYLAFALGQMLKAPQKPKKKRPVVDSDGRRLYKTKPPRHRSALAARYGPR